MIRQLRRRFVLANMLLAGLVLLAVFAALLAGNARQLARQSAAAMERALRWEGTPPPFTFSLPEDRPDADAASVAGRAVRGEYLRGRRRPAECGCGGFDG